MKILKYCADPSRISGGTGQNHVKGVPEMLPAVEEEQDTMC
jgi:hypothetical protein